MIEQHSPDDLVDSVVATDVFSGERDVALSVEYRCAVNSTGAAEQRLASEDTRANVGECVEVETDCVGRVKRRQPAAELVDAVVAAEPATTRGGAEPRRWDWCTPTGFDSDHVELAGDGRTICAVSNAGDRHAAKHTLGMAKADSEFVVVARGAHRGADLHTVELDRHGLFDDEIVGFAPPRPTRCNAGHEQSVGAATGHHLLRVANMPNVFVLPGEGSHAVMSAAHTGGI